MNLIEQLDEELSLNVDNWQAAVKLGAAYLKLGNLGHAYAFLSQAVGIEQNEFTLNEAGRVYAAMGRWSEALQFYEAAANKNPKNVQAANNAALAHLNIGDHDKAAEWLIRPFATMTKDEYEAADTRELDWNWAFVHLARGDYRKGWEAWNKGEGHGDRVKRHTYAPRWMPGDSGDVVFYGEQGLGDQIMFAECLYDAIGDVKKGAVVEVDERLANLFRRSFPEAKIMGTLSNEQPGWRAPANAGSIPLGSLPLYYRPSAASYRGHPYLLADPERRLMTRALLGSLGKKQKIGISWTGGLRHTGAMARSVELKKLMQSFKRIDAKFVSLEHTHFEDTEQHSVKAFDYITGRALDYDNTAALVSELDLVVSVPNTVVHLAGALGVQTLVLGSKAPSWCHTVMNMPLYKSVEVMNDWTPATAAKRIKEKLDGIVKLRSA